MKRILWVLAVVAMLAGSASGASFFWKDTKAALDGISGLATGDRGIVITSSGVVTMYYYNGSQWVPTALSGGVSIASKSSAYTLGNDNPGEAYGGVVYATGTFTLTLPEVVASNPTSSQVVAGSSFCVETIGAYTVTIDPNGNDGIILAHSSATRDTNGDAISNTSAATGDSVCLIADSASGWTTLGSRGTWAAQ